MPLCIGVSVAASFNHALDSAGSFTIERLPGELGAKSVLNLIFIGFQRLKDSFVLGRFASVDIKLNLTTVLKYGIIEIQSTNA